MVDSPCVLALPTSLVLLLHLHILSYPQCNSPEYSPEKLFSRNRPLRERTKTMEDIVAFLVEKIEGQERCKSILGGTYPCLQPSDTVTFRIHVAKYLETLRNAVTRPSLQVSTKARIPTGKALQTKSLSSKAKSSTKDSRLDATRNTTVSLPHTSSLRVAWWWSAIVVRKSLLEECCGDRFEKLLLALSTHALFVQVPTSSDLHPLDAAIPSLTKSLQDQSQEYASLLSRAMGLYAERIQSASNLNIRTRKLMTLRSHLESMHRDETEGLSTQRLLGIQDSKRQDFMDAWQTNHHPGLPGADGEQPMSASNALKWISSFVGISAANIQRGTPTSSVETAPSASLNLETVTVQTLPIASAHHPAMMHKLRSLPSLVPLHLDSAEDKVTDARSSPTLPCFQELLDVASSQKTALEAALEAAVKARKNVSQRLNERVETASPDTNTDESKQLDLRAPVVEPSPRAKTSPTRDPSITDDSGCTSESLAVSDEPHTQQQIESSTLNARESPEPHVPPPSIHANADLSASQEPPQQLTPLSTTQQQSGEPPLPLDVPPSRNSWPLISSPPASDAEGSPCQEPPALTTQLSSQLLLATEMPTSGSARPPVSNWDGDRPHQEESPSITKKLSSQLPVVTEVTTHSGSQSLSISDMDYLHHEELSQQEIPLIVTKELSDHLPSVAEFSTHGNSQAPIASPSISSADVSYSEELQQQETTLTLTIDLNPSLVMEVSTRNNSLPSTASPSTLGADNTYSEELPQQRTSLAITEQPSNQLPLVTEESVNGPSASPSTSDANSSCSKNLSQQLTPLDFTKQHSGQPLSVTEMSTPSNSTFQSAVTISPMTPLTSNIPHGYETSTPAPHCRSKHRGGQATTRSPGSDNDVALFTPRDSHDDVSAVRTDTMMTSRPQLMIADMSLPDVSLSDIAEFDRVPSREFDIPKREQRHEPVAELDQTEIPYEGHSITLRDILVRAGNEDSFHLIDGLQDVDEGLGDETIVWE